MSELKRNLDFATRAAPAAAAPRSPGIDDSQPWHTGEMQHALDAWDDCAQAGFDPYNHVGSRARKPQAA